MTDLHDLLHDAVDDIEPTDRLVELRARTADPARAAARPWFWAAGATVLATAAAVAVIAVVTNDDPASDPHHEHHVASDPALREQVVPVYFLGPDGSGLVREFDRVPGGDLLQAALDRMQQPPSDPDYFTVWPAGSFRTATVGDGAIDVEIGDAILQPDNVQQVVYTVQAAVGEQLPVRFLEEGRPVSRFNALPQLDVLYPVNISDPAEGNEYAGSFTARGRVRTTELLLVWDVLAGQTVVASGNTTIDPGQGSFSPWSAEVDLSGLAPGRYTFRVSTGNVGYGAEPFADTRTINVR